MLDTESIKTLKERVVIDTVFDFEDFENSDEVNIFSNYKKIMKIEDKIDNYLKEIRDYKTEISKNILHDNSKVRAIFSKYMNILKEIEEYLLGKKDMLINIKKEMVECFSNLFKEKELM